MCLLIIIRHKSRRTDNVTGFINQALFISLKSKKNSLIPVEFIKSMVVFIYTGHLTRRCEAEDGIKFRWKKTFNIT